MFYSVRIAVCQQALFGLNLAASPWVLASSRTMRPFSVLDRFRDVARSNSSFAC